jgi:hypothetical protein
MELQQAKMLKEDLEKTITKLCQDFEIQTELTIDGFSIFNCYTVNKKRPGIIRIEIDTKLI